jgi:hypoxanthine phosphoribosyltransferase
MQTIQLKGLTFEEYLSAQQIDAEVSKLAHRLSQDYHDQAPLFLPVLSGAFIFTADLIRKMSIQPELQFVKLSTYGDSMSSSRKVRDAYGLDKIQVKDRHILIIEDIIDTGFTVSYLLDFLRKLQPASVRVASLLFKPDAYEGQDEPDYFCFDIPNDFVVGYGLDYAQQGRSLPSIYRKKG